MKKDRMLEYIISTEKMTEYVNGSREYYMGILVKEGIISKEQYRSSLQYVTVVHTNNSNIFGSFWRKIFNPNAEDSKEGYSSFRWTVTKIIEMDKKVDNQD